MQKNEKEEEMDGLKMELTKAEGKDLMQEIQDERNREFVQEYEEETRMEE